jgi:hypothetical protein
MKTWFEMNEGTSSEAARETKKKSTKNSVRDARVVADGKDVETTRE